MSNLEFCIARRSKSQTQMGNQGHSSNEIRLLKEWLADGVIGKVAEVHAWTDRPVGGDPWSNFAVQEKPKDTPPVPETLDWDLWLGPAPYRPYHTDYHPLSNANWEDVYKNRMKVLRTGFVPPFVLPGPPVSGEAVLFRTVGCLSRVIDLS